MSNSSILPIDRTLSAATIPGSSGSGSNGNEGVLNFPQISKAGSLSSDSLISYAGHSLKEWGVSFLSKDVFHYPSRCKCSCLCHINTSRLFNAKSTLYIYIYIYMSMFVCLYMCVCVSIHLTLDKKLLYNTK